MALSLLLALFLARVGWLLSGGTVPATGGAAPLRRIPVDRQVLALTFEVNWGEEIPAQVLAILRAQRAPATFFVSGPWAAAHPDLLRRMMADGHEVGSIGSRQALENGQADGAIAQEIRTAQRSIQQVTGRETRLFRPADGQYDDRVLQAAARSGYTVVLWDLDAQDWATPGPDYIINRVVTQSKPGDIVRFSASDDARDTPAALAAAIHRLRARGFELVTLSRLQSAAAPGQGRP